METRDDWTLRAAAWLSAVEVTVLILVVLLRSVTRTPLLVAGLAVKYPFCALVTKRSPGAFLMLLFWEVCGALFALTAPRVAIGVRITVAVTAATVVVLLVRSLKLFPTPEIPER